MPYSINWNNNSSSSIINNLAPGEYSYEVIDANSCPKGFQIL